MAGALEAGRSAACRFQSGRPCGPPAAAGSTGAAPALPPLQQEQQQSQQLPAQTGAAPVLQPGGPQTAGVAPPGGNSDTDLNMEEKELKELLELGASPEELEGFKAVTARIQKARGSRSGPYGYSK